MAFKVIAGKAIFTKSWTGRALAVPVQGELLHLGETSYARKRRRTAPAAPSNPVASKPSVPGSGTGVGTTV